MIFKSSYKLYTDIILAKTLTFLLSTLNDKSDILVLSVRALAVITPAPPGPRVLTTVTRLMMAEVLEAALVSLRVEAECGRGSAHRGQRRSGAASREPEPELRVSLGDGLEQGGLGECLEPAHHPGLVHQTRARGRGHEAVFLIQRPEILKKLSRASTRGRG